MLHAKHEKNTAKTRPVAMGWPRQQHASFFPPMGTFLQFFIAVISLQVKERSPEILAELNLGHSDILSRKLNLFFHLIVIIQINK